MVKRIAFTFKSVCYVLYDVTSKVHVLQFFSIAMEMSDF